MKRGGGDGGGANSEKTVSVSPTGKQTHLHSCFLLYVLVTPKKERSEEEKWKRKFSFKFS